MRVLALLLTLLYAAAVAVQYNDPDALRWMMIYGAACAMSLLVVLRQPKRPLMILVAVVALVWAGFLVPQILDLGVYSLDVEIEREFGGLVIVALGMLVQMRADGAS